MSVSNNIIIVGNGHSLLENKNGSLIDSYDTVVRFNSFEISGYEPYVGQKTDIWMTCVRQKKQHINGVKKILIHPSNYEITLNSIDDKNKCEIIDWNLIRSIPLEWPSSGIIAIYYFLSQKYSKLTITGFDWWKNEKHHYFGDVEVRGTTHKPLEEYKIIKKFVDEGKIFFLNPQ